MFEFLVSDFAGQQENKGVMGKLHNHLHPSLYTLSNNDVGPYR